MTTAISILSAGRRVDLSDKLEEFSGVVRYLRPGEWTCKLASSAATGLVAMWPTDNDAPSPQLVVSEGTRVLLSGAAQAPTLHRSGGVTTVNLVGVDEYALLENRLVYPQPADAPPWNTDAYDVVTGQASAAVAELIRRHAGDLARPERVVPGLVVEDQGAGPDGTWKFRLADLASAVGRIGEEADLSIEVHRQADGTRLVQIGAVRNRTSLLLDETKLDEFELSLTAPTVTTPIAGGSGEGTSRLFAIAGDTVVGEARRESFSDQRNIDSLPALQRSADATRAAGSASTSMSGSLTIEAADAYRWGRDYNLGDRLRLRAFGTTWEVAVSAVSLKADTTGWRFAPVLGVRPKNALEALLQDVAGLANRLNTVEVS